MSVDEDKKINDRLNRLNKSIIRCIEKALKQVSTDVNKNNEITNNGIVDTGKLRHIIQSVKDLKTITAQNSVDDEQLSKIYEALEKEDDVRETE